MQGFHDMTKLEPDTDEPRWMLYAALVGAGAILGLLIGQIATLL